MFKRLLASATGKTGEDADGHRPGTGPLSAPTPHVNGSTPAPRNPAKNKISTVLGPGTTLAGKLVCPGGTRIEGSFDGELDVDGPLLIGENAYIIADISAAAVQVGGVVKGNITAERVEILATGRVYGDLTTQGFSAEEGGFLRGQIHMPDLHAEEMAFAPPVEDVAAGEAFAEPAPPAPASNLEALLSDDLPDAMQQSYRNGQGTNGTH